MNQLSQFDAVPEESEISAQTTDFAMEPAAHTIRRFGQRPLSFHGTELCMAMNFHPQAPYWHEINIYRTTEMKFVVCVRLFYQSTDERDSVEAWECETFAEAMDTLETYEAANDIRINVNPSDPHMSVPEMAALSLSLRAQAAEARRIYRSLVGELLHDLENG